MDSLPLLFRWSTTPVQPSQLTWLTCRLLGMFLKCLYTEQLHNIHLPILPLQHKHFQSFKYRYEFPLYHIFRYFRYFCYQMIMTWPSTSIIVTCQVFAVKLHCIVYQKSWNKMFSQKAKVHGCSKYPKMIWYNDTSLGGTVKSTQNGKAENSLAFHFGNIVGTLTRKKHCSIFLWKGPQVFLNYCETILGLPNPPKMYLLWGPLTGSCTCLPGLWCFKT